MKHMLSVILIVCLFSVRTTSADTLPVQFQPLSKKTVEVFVTSWCGYCKRLEQFLKAKKIPYTRYDVERDAVGQRKFRQLGGDGVPFVRIGDKIISGFFPESILQALD